MHDDKVDPVGDHLLRQRSAMAAVGGVLDRQVYAALQRVRDEVACGRCGGSGGGVDDQHGTHVKPPYPGRRA